MTQLPAYSYRRNLEAAGADIEAGGWRMRPLLDQVSEKRFLLFSLRSRALPELMPSVLAFRGEAAVGMSPSTCPPVLTTTVDGDRVEFLTDYFDLLEPGSLAEPDLERVIDGVLRTLVTFEQHQFHCSDLFPAAIGLDDNNEVKILPNAYLLPFISGEGSLRTSVGLRFDLKSSTKLRTLDSHVEINSCVIHASLLAKLIELLLPGERGGKGDGAFATRLLHTMEGIVRKDVTSVSEAYRRIFGKPLENDDSPMAGLRGEDVDRASVDSYVDEIVRHTATEGSVILVKGDSYTGKSDILRKATSLMDRSDDFSVLAMDEWDLFSRSRRQSMPKGSSSVHAVWVVDDIDETALAYSDFAAAMLESDSYPKGSVVFSVRTSGIVDEVKDFVDTLRSARRDRFIEISTEATEGRPESVRLASHLNAALGAIDPDHTPNPAAVPEDLARAFLDELRPVERQFVELVSVARFALPLDLVLSVFTETPARTREAILQLTGLNIVDLIYRRVSPKNAVALFVRMESTALRRLIYESIPPARRRKLHRTIALLAEQQGSFPRYLLLFHCLRSEDKELAARHAVAYLKDVKSEKRHPSIVSLIVELAQKELLEDVSFSDQILVNYETAVDLLNAGRAEDAEKLLLKSQETIEQAGSDLMLKNAQRLSATYRLLADRWEARGEFTGALDLLEMARDELQAALPIPDQAQLLNDIGWLQYRLGDYEKSMESCRLSLNTLNANQYPSIVAQALNLMGVVHFNTSRYDEAISYYEQSAYLREKSGDENTLAASFNNLALAYQSKGEYEKAFDYYEKSLELKKRQNNKAGIAGGYLNLALLYLEGRNFKEAEAKCRESLAISEELGNAQLAADNYITLGDIALEGGDLEAAEHHYQESFRISNQREAINEEMGALRRLSTICLRQARYDEAREYAEAAEDLVQRIGSKYENAQIQVILGDLELKQGRTVEAVEQYEKASAQYTALSKYRLAATVLSKIGLIHAEMGNHFEARTYLDRAQDFVRADIGQELPEEFVELQQVLRAHPARTQIVGKESQKLLMAFYDLTALTDYAMDRHEFFRKIMDVIRQIVDPVDCYLALETGNGRFHLVDSSGERSPGMTKGMATLFQRTLLRGGLLDSRSSDVTDLLQDAEFPDSSAFVCIPLKAMSEDLGCLLFYLAEDHLPLSKEDVNFFTWLGRQIAGNLKLMLHLNEDFLKDEILDGSGEQAGAQGPERHHFEKLIGKSEAMKKIFRTLERVKDTDSSILILGESGTGKTALASAIHYNSPRQNRPFQEIHCAQIPHNLLESELFGHERGSFTGAVQRKIGLCEIANGGTLFLDDINVMPVETQTKLLQFIANKSYMRLGGTQKLTSDVRIITASNEDLEKLCAEGKFREDLYYRLKVILVHLPPLRDRKDDMLAIALDYLKRSCSEKGLPLKTLSPEAIQLFQKAPWRGNVRELQNVLERVVVLSDETVITPASLPDDFLKEVMGTSRQSHQRLDELVDEIVRLGSYSESNPLLPVLEAMLAKRMVEHVKSKNHAAGMLGISKPTLYARLRDYDKMH